MTPRFSARSTPRFERLSRNLLKAHPELRAIRDRVGEGQWRLALGRFRFRYDIVGQEVVLHHCALRQEDTYRER